MKSVRAYLIALVVTCMLLSSIGFGVLLWQAHETSRREVVAQGAETAQALSLAVDAELERASGVLVALAQTNAVHNRDWASVDRVARAAFPNGNAWIIVQDRSGQQWVNSGLPRGSRLPHALPPREMWSVLDKGEQHICNLVPGAIERHIVCVDVGEGSARLPDYAISVIYRPQYFRSIVRRENVEAGELASLIDRTGVVIWRNRSPERFVGKPVSRIMQSHLRAAASGAFEGTNLEGVRTLTAFRRSPISGWTVIVGVPSRTADANLRGALKTGSVVALIIAILGCLLAAVLAARLTRGLEQLGHLLDPKIDPSSYRETGLAEFDATAAALKAAFEARLRSERNQEMLIGELNHRVKNTLAVVQSLSWQTFRSADDPAAAVAAFDARLTALGQAHNVLTRERWHSAPLREIVDVAMAPFCSPDRCDITGPRLTVPPHTGVNLALALHELGTNAVKYGALASDAGLISIEWTKVGESFELLWQESGAPPVTPPTRRGFGTRLIERSLAAELDGEVTLDFAPDGLKCRVVGKLGPRVGRDVLESLGV